MIPLEMNDIFSFLHFGYLPYRKEKTPSLQSPIYEWSKLPGRLEKTALKESDIVAEGTSLLRACFQNTKGALHVVPLSGGIDSRVVLGGLMEAGLKESIVTATFGTPGSLDFDLGVALAQRFGLRHELFDLTNTLIDVNSLMNTSTNGAPWTFLFDAFYNSLISRRFGLEAVYWSGFMGGELAGTHVPETSSKTWEEAKGRFAASNRFVRSIALTPPNFHPEDVLPLEPIAEDEKLSLDDQLDFAIRQEFYIRPTVLPAGFEYRTPFLHPDWVNFTLSLPRRYRRNEYLFKKIALTAFPELFTLPVANAFGLPLVAPVFLQQRNRLLMGLMRRIDAHGGPKHRNAIFALRKWLKLPLVIKYLDFDEVLRQKEDLRLLIYDCIVDLDHRSMVKWLDLDKLWQNHQKRRANHGMALALLAALEINLKTQHASLHNQFPAI